MLVHYLCCLLFLYIYGVYIWYIYGNMVYIYIYIDRERNFLYRIFEFLGLPSSCFFSRFFCLVSNYQKLIEMMR